MEIEREVVLGAADGPDENISGGPAYYELPVTKANAMAYYLLRNIYSAGTGGEDDAEARGELIALVDRFAGQKSGSGSADDFHNFAVELARFNEYELSCKIVEFGLKFFPKNCDLLADYLQYGLNCGKTKECRKYFKILFSVPHRRWTWRSFSFVVNYLQFLAEQSDGERVISQIFDSLGQPAAGFEEAGVEERAMLSVAAEFKRYFPHSEEPYRVEAQIYTYLKRDDLALETLGAAERELSVCPKCSLRRADMLFNRGDYDEAGLSVQRALNGSVQTQSSVNEGYLHYLLALCIFAGSRKKDAVLNGEEAKLIYGHFNDALVEFGDDHQSFKDVIRRTARNVKSESREDIPDECGYLIALTED